MLDLLESKSFGVCDCCTLNVLIRAPLLLRCCDSCGLHHCVRSGCADSPPVRAETGAEDQHRTEGAQRQNGNRLQDRAAPAQLAHTHCEGVLHLTKVCIHTHDYWKGLTDG